MKELSEKIKSKIEKVIRGEVEKFVLKKDAEQSRLRKRLASLDAPVTKTHLGELDSTYTNEASGSSERIKTINHVIVRCHDALHRLKNGDYGVCVECGESISLGRLKAVPFTEHCADCKKEKEDEIKRHTPPGVPRQTSVSYT